MNSVLYQMSVIKTESESEESENNSFMCKKSKINQVTSMLEVKQVLGQLTMNHQEHGDQPAQKKRRISDGSSTKTKSAPAVAVQRRNARERNRVKQVNNGFSMLRDHIPPEIAETFEQAGRGSAKKLSKVETLRMAVEYIRSLEKMLALDTSNDSESSSPSYHMNSTSFSNMSTMSEASLPATPPPESQQPFFYALKPHSGVTETQITIVGGQQYIRIPGTNTFQLVTHDMFENDENMHPNSEFTTIQIHPPSSSSPSLNEHTMNFMNEINSGTSVINTTTTTSSTMMMKKTPAGSISPYSGHSSLSPAPSHAAADNIGNNIIMADARLSCIAGRATEPNDQKLPYDHMMMHCANSEASHYDNIILKQEIADDDGIFDESSLSNENMMDAMQWWEQQQQHMNQHSSP